MGTFKLFHRTNQLCAGGKRRLAFMLVTLLALVAFGSRAANILVDPGFESAAQGNAYPAINGWTVYGQSWGNVSVVGSPVNSGANSLKVYGGFTASDNYNGAYQDNPSGPGDIYVADCWAQSTSADQMAGGNQVWIEVTFRDANAQILALYRSSIITSTNIASGDFPADTWNDLPVTNQYDPNTYQITNTVTSLVAPPGTVTVRFQILFLQTGDNAGGSMFFDDATLNQTGGPVPPVISGISLDNSAALFNYTNALSFVASSPDVGINASGIQLTLNGADVSSNLVFLGAGAETVNVSYTNLVANRVYTGQIKVTDGNGLVQTAAVRFDTFNPTNYVWEAEDFDFNGGSFIDSPILSSNSASSYYNQTGTTNIDEYVGNYSASQPHNWRPNDQVATDLANDTPRPQFAAAGFNDYEVGYFDPTNWVNYTHTYPAGNYTIYARVANGNGGLANCYLDEVTNGQQTASQTTTRLGQFEFTGRGWTSYDFVPLTDPWGNVVTVNLNGKTTLRVTAGPLGGGVNMNFFMLAPARTDLPPAIANVYPDGSEPFQATNQLSFTVTSANSTIAKGAVQVVLNGTNLSSQLQFSGSPNNWQVSLPLPNQGLYSGLAITVTDANNRSTSYSVGAFDTFSQDNMMIEAEDFDFNGGQFIQDPIPTATADPDSYFEYPMGDYNNYAIVGIDLTTPSTDGGEQFAYRPYESCGTEVTSDFLRQKFVVARGTDPNVSDYDVGWWNGGTWLNYTRIFPTNNYNIYARMAGGGGAYSASMAIVTGGWGTTLQTSNVLGTLNDNGTGWQSWQWVPLMNNGQMAVVALGGTNTVKAISGGGFNANFFMFVPVATTAAPVAISATVTGSTIHISFPTQSSSVNYTVLYKNNLTDATWQTLTTVPGNSGTQTVTDSTTGQSQRYYRLSIQ